MGIEKEYLKEAFVAYLESKGKKSRNWLAKKCGVKQQTVNNICNGSFGQEEKRDQILKYIGIDLLSFLEYGKKAYNKKHGIKDITDHEHREKITEFADQERALRINTKLVWAEKLNFDSLDKIEKQIDIELEDLEKRHPQEAPEKQGEASSDK